jgi:5-hydroxyisourate hydrolase
VSLSTHVLDATTGRPAADVAVNLHLFDADTERWRAQHLGTTDADGRMRLDGPLWAGTYRITFYTGKYFAARGVATFYPEVVVTFSVTSETEHYHVPLLLSPFSYSTYRGS